MTGPELPQLVRHFVAYNVPEVIPRLFYHLNQSEFDPETRFPALAESLKILNPEMADLNFNWQLTGSDGWIIDMGNNPELDTISPLCGLSILMLNASNIGAPDLGLLTEEGMVELRLAGSQLNHLFDLDQLTGLQSLDISRTGIRNLTNLLKYSKLRTLDISAIDGLAISPQLIWNRNLKILTVSEAFREDRTIKALARRGVIIIYTDN